MAISIPHDVHPICLLEPAADGGGRTGDYVSLKNFQEAYILCFMDQGNAATIAWTPNQATAVAGTSTKAISATQIWANEDTDSGSTLTAQTAAADFTTSAAVKKKVVIFRIDPDALDVANGFDCVTVITGASNAANITSALLLGVPRYKPAPDAIVD